MIDPHVPQPDGTTPAEHRANMVQLVTAAASALQAVSVYWEVNGLPGDWSTPETGYPFAQSLDEQAHAMWGWLAMVKRGGTPPWLDLGVQCVNPDHTHTTTVDRDGTETDGDPFPASCDDCEQPAHYEQTGGHWAHDDPAAQCRAVGNWGERTPCRWVIV